MTGKTKKTILVILLGLVIIAAYIGYSLYNKKHFSVENATPAAVTSAADLHNTFVKDSAQAKTKFIGDENNHKVIKVDGEVAEVKKDQQGNTIILLKTATDGAFINCTMEGKADGITAGSKIALQGICTGYNFDAEMGIPGDVILVRSFIAK